MIPAQAQVYEPYGAPISHGPTDGPGFAGHVEDSATGLTYMQQRYYDPQINRFVTVDPVEVRTKEDWRAFPRYNYAYNNPYTFSDPDGRCPNCVVTAAYGALAGGIGGGVVGYALGGWKGAVAGAVGGAVGGAITGGTLGAGSTLGQIVASGITGGILGELAGETVENALNNGANTDSWKYDPLKIAVAGVVGAVGAHNGLLVESTLKSEFGPLASGLANEAVMAVPNAATAINIEALREPQGTVTVGAPEQISSGSVAAEKEK